MKTCTSAMALNFLLVATVTPAHACRMNARLDLQDVKQASVVVVGKIWDYEVVPSQPGKPGFGRFKVLVSEVLVGQSPKSLVVTWFNSTLGYPDKLAEGRALIALREINYPKPNTFMVLQTPCSQPFIFQSTSAEAEGVRKILSEK